MREHEWARAKVSERIDWAPGLFTLRFDLVLGDFRPGQFVAVGIDDDPPVDEAGKRKRLHRLYSIASAPHAPAEFFIVEVENGAVSPFLSTLHPGDEGWITKYPKGLFTLDRVPEAPNLWLMSTGTGLAPFISLLRTEEPWDRFERIVVVYGVRANEELAYSEELEGYRRDGRAQFSVVRSVTREEPSPGVYAGRITAALEDGKLVEMAGVPLEPSSSQVMLCGNPAMIQQMTNLLKARGFLDNTKKTPGHLTFERYW